MEDPQSRSKNGKLSNLNMRLDAAADEEENSADQIPSYHDLQVRHMTQLCQLQVAMPA